MRKVFMSDEHEALELEITKIRKMVRRAKTPVTRNRLVDKQAKLVTKLHGMSVDGQPIDKRHLAY